MPGRFVPRVPTGRPLPAAGPPAAANPPPVADFAGHRPAGDAWSAAPRRGGRPQPRHGHRRVPGDPEIHRGTGPYRAWPDAGQPAGATYRPGGVVTDVPAADRHRTGARLPGPIGLAALVAALLVTFGVGAFLLSPGLVRPGDAAGSQLPGGVEAPAADPSTATDSPAIAAGVGPASPLAAVPSPSVPSPSAPARPAPAAPATSAPVVERAKPSPTKARSATAGREDQVTLLINKARVAAGCRSVRTDERLRAAARGHSRDMAVRDYFAHDSLDGRSPWDRAKAAGYAQPIGENIAKGQRTPAAVVQAWLDSPGHRRNILNCDARATGVGLVYDGSTPIWTQMFGSR